MNIGLTGGIASGKSTVSNQLMQLGAHLIDADQLAREVVMPGTPALREVSELFGQVVMHKDGSLNRKQLGDIIFRDERKRKELEGILHPRIRKLMMEQMTEAEKSNPERLVVVDVPLLYESGLESMFEEVLVVYIPAELQLQRLMNRDGITEEQALIRLKTQSPIEDKKNKADYVIDNQGTLENTKQQVIDFWKSKRL